MGSADISISRTDQLHADQDGVMGKNQLRCLTLPYLKL